MTAIIDPAKNMRRFYRLDVQRDLFGQWCQIREWEKGGRGKKSEVKNSAETAGFSQRRVNEARYILRNNAPVRGPAAKTLIKWQTA